MKVKVERTSGKIPCDTAVEEWYIVTNEHPVDCPTKLPWNNPRENWYNSGKNHRVENGHIKRDFEYKGWFIEVNTLYELLEFSKKHGEIIVNYNDFDYDGMSIEIYDTYRE